MEIVAVKCLDITEKTTNNPGRRRGEPEQRGHGRHRAGEAEAQPQGGDAADAEGKVQLRRGVLHLSRVHIRLIFGVRGPPTGRRRRQQQRQARGVMLPPLSIERPTDRPTDRPTREALYQTRHIKCSLWIVDRSTCLPRVTLLRFGRRRRRSGMLPYHSELCE